ncbi:MAG: hypothetical protein KGO03_01760 [Gemmatimonadota bacterium]|nr:hypothetical protein [Gemmatimonadota bacterium]
MRGRSARRTSLLAAVALAGVVAAASGCRTGAPLGTGAPRVRTATLSVQNNDIDDRVVYVSLDGLRQRLGIARSAATTYFTIPATFVSGSPQVRFLAEVLGGVRPSVSQRTQVAAGDTVEMVILR